MNTLVIRADATSVSGTGHVMRCLALAQAWQDKGGKVVFISHCESEILQRRIIFEGIDFISIDKTHPDSFDCDLTRGVLDKLKTGGEKTGPWLVVDGYHFDAEYQKSIKAAGYKLLWIDDYGHAAHYYADLVLNQNISADPSCYANRESYTQLLLGTRYVLLRREFGKWQGWQRPIPTMARKVLVTLGGADPDNVTLKAIQALKMVEIPGLEARIVIGAANPHREILQREIGDNSKLRLLSDVADMPELMAWADVAISAGGSTCWELAFMGLPNFIFILADNQIQIAESLNDFGIALNLGWPKNIDESEFVEKITNFLSKTKRRKEMSNAGQKLVDGLGGQRVLSHLTD